MPISHRRLHRRAGSSDDEQQEKRADDAPVIRTVYKTLEATFEGAIGGYKTVGKDDDEAAETTQAAPKKTSTSVKAEQTKESKKPAATTTTKETKAKSTSQVATKTSEQDRAQTKETTKAKETTSEKEVSKTKAKTTSTSVPSVISVPTETDLGSVLAKATGEASVSQTASLVADSKATNTQALVSATSTSDASSSSKDSSSSAGAKAGIAFGVLGGLLLVGMLVFFIFNRRKKAADRERLDDDEKVHRSIGGAPAVAVADSDAMSTRTDPRAPRISLRPVTQFLPNLNIDKRSSKGAAMALAPAAAAAGAVAGASAQNRGQGQNYYDQSMNAQNAHPANPFGNHAERIPTPIIEEQSMHTSSSPPSPVSDRSLGQDPFASSGQALAVAVPLARKASMRKDGPKQLDLTLPNISISPIPASPSGTEFSMSPASPDATTPVSAGAAAIAAAGGPANSPVHRVQLDFKPTLEDELELMAGQLVRILHEYDDGWALCIRLDRSRQGVVPRTCLSTRPVKPRPAQAGPRPGPPIKPNGPPRGPGPNFPPGQRPMTPQGQRPMTPQGRPGYGPPHPGGRSQSPMGRQMSPGPRAQSPGPRQGPPGGRSQSPSGTNSRASPPGPSPMNPIQAPRPQGPPTGPVGRKPVPGQAY